MRLRWSFLLIALGVALLLGDLAMGAFAEMDPDVMQAFDMLLMPTGVFCVAEGAFGVWRGRRLGRLDNP